MEIKTIDLNFTVSIREGSDRNDYSVTTCECLAKELGTSRQVINGYTQTISPKTGLSKLDYCFPHEISTSKGPKYIVMNTKYDALVATYKRKMGKRSKKKG